MAVKCALCGVEIREKDMVKCKCGKQYHKVMCAVQAVGSPDGTVDACCGVKRTMRGDVILSQHSVREETDSESDDFQSPSKVNLAKKEFDLGDVKEVMMQVLEESVRLRNVKGAIDGLMRLSSSLRSEVMEHRNRLVMVQQDVERIDQELKAVVERQEKSRPEDGGVVVQACMEELVGQQAMKKNDITHGLAEGRDEGIVQRLVSVNYVRGEFVQQSKENVVTYDYEFVSKLIGLSVKSLRLGNRGQADQKVRPIKIQFNDELTARLIFQAARKI